MVCGGFLACLEEAGGGLGKGVPQKLAVPVRGFPHTGADEGISDDLTAVRPVGSGDTPFSGKIAGEGL